MTSEKFQHGNTRRDLLGKTGNSVGVVLLEMYLLRQEEKNLENFLQRWNLLKKKSVSN